VAGGVGGVGGVVEVGGVDGVGRVGGAGGIGGIGGVGGGVGGVGEESGTLPGFVGVGPFWGVATTITITCSVQHDRRPLQINNV